MRQRMKRFPIVGLIWLLGWSLLILDFGFWIFDLASAHPAADPLPSAIPNPKSNIQHPKSGGPWINLQDGRELPTVYSSASGLQQVLGQQLVVPTAMASADFDEDSVPDLICGYADPSGGLVTRHRGNVEALWPRHRGSGVRGQGSDTTDHGPRTTDAPPFLPEARVFELPAAPNFLGAGDFDADGHWDIVAAARDSDQLLWLPGDGRGSFGPLKQIRLPGSVTALTVGEINRRDGLADVVVGVSGSDGPQVVVFEGPNGALSVGASVPGRPPVAAGDLHAGGHREPPRPVSVSQWETIPLPAEAMALALGQLDESYEMDLAVAAGSELVIVHGRDRKLSIADSSTHPPCHPPLEQRSFPFEITSLAVGDFVWDEAHQTDMAVLAEDGAVQVLTHPTGAEVKAGAHGEAPVQAVGREAHPVRAALRGRPRGPSPAARLVCANLSSLPTDELIVLDQSNHQLHILTMENGQRTMNNEPRTKDQGLRTPASLDLSSAPVAVLPMRLNRDALSDLVILTEGSSAPAVALTAPLATFTVNATSDGSDINPGDGICSASALAVVCTLRAAIEEANAKVGADLIAFNIPGPGPHTITPASNLPIITDPVTIDGYTQPGSSPNTLPDGDNAVLKIELNGVNAGPCCIATGLEITAGNSVVRGLVINRFNGREMRLGVNGSNVIEGNFIGTDVAGTGAPDVGNTGSGGVSVGSSNNTIGGTAAAARNLLSNNPFGVQIGGGGSSNLVQGNFIGTDISGTMALANLTGLMIFGGMNNTIGGTTAGARNVISGNGPGDFGGGKGVILNGNGGLVVGNLVQGNFIGTDVTGTQALGNAGNGVMFHVGGSSSAADVTLNTIGGTTPGARNVISGNTLSGVFIEDFIVGSPTVMNNLVQGNFIGTDVTGTQALGNGLSGNGFGVNLESASGNTIGGVAAGAGNVISSNGNTGVRISGSDMTVVQGNFIGTDLTGMNALGNANQGLRIDNANNNIIGGSNPPSARNVISANADVGVRILFGFGNQVRGNFIGTDVTGAASLGNGSAGVAVFSGTGNPILSNAISFNGGLGIDLDVDGVSPTDGVTPNDLGPPPDSDTGSNQLQNYPVLTSATATASGITIQGTLTSTPNERFTLQFFSNLACDPSGYGEGQTLIGSTLVTTDASGMATFAVTFSVTVCGSIITATATDSNGNTSEFSPCLTATGEFFCPRLQVSPSSLNFGAIPVLASEEQQLMVRNIGTAPLLVTPHPPTSVSPFQLVSPREPFTLAPGQRRQVMVRFLPLLAGQFGSRLMIQSNDPTQPVVHVGLMGVACSPPLLSPIPDPITLEFDTIRVIFLSVLEAEAFCGYSFSLSPELPFVTLTDNGDGTAFLRLAPGPDNIGTHRLTVTVTVNTSPPQSDSQTITIQVTR